MPPTQHLRVTPAARKLGDNEMPGLGRSMVISSAIAMSVVFVLVGVGMVLSGVTYPLSVAVALFTAAWGGGGFGAMIGGVLHTHRVPAQTGVN